MKLAPTTINHGKFTSALVTLNKAGGKKNVCQNWHSSGTFIFAREMDKEKLDKFYLECYEWIVANKVLACIYNYRIFFKNKSDLLYFQIKWTAVWERY